MSGSQSVQADVYTAPHILLVDDDERILALLERYLKDQGMIVTTASDSAKARVHLSLFEFDMLIVDVMMPGEDGISLTRSIRESSPVPIIMLTAMGQPDDRISGLESGADDYIPKPFDPRELVLRIRAILRRTSQTVPGQSEIPSQDIISFGECAFDLVRETLTRQGEPIHLTTAEIALLRVLSEHAGDIVSREDLAKLTGAEGGLRTIDVQVTRLRKKLEGDSRTPRYLRTVRGKGYQLVPD